jgi:hypothetical protein
MTHTPFTYTPRERELMDKLDAKTITDAELAELSKIKEGNISHLRFNGLRQ